MPPHLFLNAMQRYDVDIRRSFANCAGVDTSDTAWKQVKMSLRRGGLGLRSLADHSSAAYTQVEVCKLHHSWIMSSLCIIVVLQIVIPYQSVH